jgi:N-acetylneuraminate synthase
MTSQAIIIAEAGVNHDGDLDKAIALVDAAAAAGADFVKFQTFKASALAVANAPKAPYQKRTTDAAESQLDMLRRLELPRHAHEKLIGRAAELGIGFLSTPFDRDSLALLISLGLPCIKVGSGDMTNAVLLLEIARSGRDVILSTGMATLGEIEEMLGVLAYGYSNTTAPPGRAAFRFAWSDPVARQVVAKRVTLLHCTTEYPCPAQDANLRAIDVMREAFGLRVGFSDHTDGISVAIAAIARGACTLEKHLTLSRSASGPDHAASIEPAEFRAMVAAIRTVEAAMGDGVKAPRASERANIPIARKSPVAARRIRAGDKLAPDDIAMKRPGDGRPPIDYWDLLGTIAPQGREIDEPL